MKAKEGTAKRNAVKTRARILGKATDFFARKGYEGTSVREIVEASGVTKRMIYHYFGDKEGLYRAIFVHEWAELQRWFNRSLQLRDQKAAAAPSMNSRELLAQSVATFFDFLTERPEFVRLMMWEGLEGGAISRSIWNDVRGPLYKQMEFLIEQAQEDGLLNINLDAAHLVVSFLGAITFYFAYAPTLLEILQEEPFTAHALQKRKEQLLQMLDNLYLN